MYRYFEVNTHVNPTFSRYVTDESWEDQGFTVDEDGNPIKDQRGNTVALFAERAVCTDDADLLLDTYSGGSPLESEEDFDAAERWFDEVDFIEGTDPDEILTQWHHGN